MIGYPARGSVFAYKPDSAVSPVVGIMLMLTVTLILAAIISGYAGGVAKTQSKPPQLVFEASMVNDSTTPTDSFLDVRIISVSEGIPSKDLKFQTEWRGKDSAPYLTVSTPLGSGYPLGYDPSDQTVKSFGNFTLLAGTHLIVNNTTGLNAVLSNTWSDPNSGMSEGTPVRIQFIHVPSGAIIADKEITSET